MVALCLKTVDGPSLPIPGTDPWFAEPSDPALIVMTDFRERASITVSQDLTIDAALEHMRHTGVRCAFALDDSRGAMIGSRTGAGDLPCCSTKLVPASSWTATGSMACSPSSRSTPTT